MRIFGSRARGDAREDSDLDLFVLCESDDEPAKRSLIDLAWEVAYELELPHTPSVQVMSRATSSTFSSSSTSSPATC